MKTFERWEKQDEKRMQEFPQANVQRRRWRKRRRGQWLQGSNISTWLKGQEKKKAFFFLFYLHRKKKIPSLPDTVAILYLPPCLPPSLESADKPRVSASQTKHFHPRVSHHVADESRETNQEACKAGSHPGLFVANVS